MIRPTVFLVLGLLVFASQEGEAAAPPVPLARDFYGDPLPPGAIARLGTVRWRASPSIDRMAFVPGDRFLATTDGRSLSVWDVATGRRVRTIRDDTTAMKQGLSGPFAITPDSKYLLSSDAIGFQATGWGGLGREPRLLLWEFATGKLLAQSLKLEGDPFAVALRGDGKLVAFSNSSAVYFWEPGKKSLRSVGEGKGFGSVEGLTFTRDDKQLIVMSEWGGGFYTYQIDVASGKILKRVEHGPGDRAAFASSQGTLATYNFDTHQLHLHDPITGKKRRLPLKEKLSGMELRFSPGGRTLLAADEFKETVVMWDVAKGQLLRSLRIQGLQRLDERNFPVVSWDGKTLAAEEGREVIRTWDATTGKPLARFPGHVYPPIRIAYSSDGKQLVSYSRRGGYSRSGVIYHWEAATGKPLSRVILEIDRDREDQFQEHLTVPGGHYLVRTIRGVTSLFDTRTGARKILRDGKALTSDAAFRGDNRTVVTAGSDQILRLWDTFTGKLLRRIVLSRQIKSISWVRFTPDGRTLVTGEGWKKIHLWEAATGKHQATLFTRRKPINDQEEDRWEVTFSPKGHFLFISSQENLWIWDVAARREARPFEVDREVLPSYREVVVSPDGRLLAWFDGSASVCLYEMASGQLVHTFEGSSWTVAFAPSGWRLATGCDDDSSILLWDLPTLFRSHAIGRPFATADTTGGYSWMWGDIRPWHVIQAEKEAWRLASLPRPATAESLWNDLSNHDAMHAYQSAWRLTTFADADALLARKLTPVKPVPANQLKKLLADLSRTDLPLSDTAEQRITALREAASPALKEAHRRAKEFRLRLRLTRLLSWLQPRAAHRLREARAVMVLEYRATPKARKLLEQLADGLPEARLTREARAALQRLKGKAKESPNR